MEDKRIKNNLDQVLAFEKENLETLENFLNSEIGGELECDEADYSEKRKALRLKLERVESWVKFSRLIFPEKYAASTLINISSMGANIRMHRKAKIGKQAMVRFVFPDANEYFVYGRVVWAENVENGYQYGVQFDKRNSILGEKIIQTHYNSDKESHSMVTLEKTPDAFIEAINTFFSKENRRLIRNEMSRK